MKHNLHYSVTLPRPLAEVFGFFADAANLQRITPPELNFSILTPQPIVMKTGALIQYRLALFGVPFSWKTEISAWDPPRLFVDRQLTGPYAEWIHRHTFRSVAEGETIMEDHVSYALPLQPLGELVHPLVRRQLEKIFTYRREAILRLLENTGV